MKKKMIVLLGCLCMLSFSLVAYGGISGSDHDFSSETWSDGQICEPCHAPHNTDTSVSGAPLWNHDVTTATFTVYASSTLDAAVGQPGGVSKLCLSCHDGTVAIDSFGENAGTDFMDGDHLLGTDLRNDHPISFTYDAALATNDGGLFDPTTTATSLGGTINADLLYSGQLECASCHDVHNGAGNDHILRINNGSSALCLTCHNK